MNDPPLVLVEPYPMLLTLLFVFRKMPTYSKGMSLRSSRYTVILRVSVANSWAVIHPNSSKTRSETYLGTFWVPLDGFEQLAFGALYRRILFFTKH
jgi:hypothetical protein